MIQKILFIARTLFAVTGNKTEEIVPSARRKAFLTAAIGNIQRLGYTFSNALLKAVLSLSDDALEDFFKSIIPILRNAVGAEKRYVPMYPNFPAQVAEASDAELYFNAIIHYLTSGLLVPDYPVGEKLPLIMPDNLKVIGLCEDPIKTVQEIVNNIAGTKTTMSKTDLAIIYNALHIKGIVLPDEIPNKENLAKIGAAILSDKEIAPAFEAVRSNFKTATDVLRLITALSDGDVSLSEKSFYSMNRKTRRLIMDLLADVNNPLEDMFRYRGKWLRVGERLHPAAYKEKKYASVVSAFDCLRNGKKPLFFNGQVEDALINGSNKEAIQLLATRPSELARRLNVFAGRGKDVASYALFKFQGGIEEVSTPVLLQLIAYFRAQAEGRDEYRVFIPKGNTNKIVVVEDDREEPDREFCNSVVKVCEDELKARFAKTKKLGKVYLDEEFKKFLVPFNQRSASKAVHAPVRGSRIKVDEGVRTLRPFIWWTNNETHDYLGRIDIDLSCGFMDEDYTMIDDVSFRSLRTDYACHSGDIINGGPVNGTGAAEFIDINLRRLPEEVRYIVFTVLSFSAIPFGEMKNCRFGWMNRDGVSGEIFEPATVQMKMDLASNSLTVIPAIYDVKMHEMVWCDASLDAARYMSVTINANADRIKKACYGMTHLKKPTLWDLVSLSADSMVETPEEADIIFSNTEKVFEREGEVIPVHSAYEVDFYMGLLE